MRRLHFQSIMTTNEIIDRPDLDRNSIQGTDRAVPSGLEEPIAVFGERDEGSRSDRRIWYDRGKGSVQD